MYIVIMKIKKNHQKNNFSLKLKKILFSRNYNYMSKRFLKIDFKFYSNVITYDQTYKYV